MWSVASSQAGFSYAAVLMGITSAGYQQKKLVASVVPLPEEYYEGTVLYVLLFVLL